MALYLGLSEVNDQGGRVHVPVICGSDLRRRRWFCQELRLSRFSWDDFCGTNKVHQVTKVQRVLI